MAKEDDQARPESFAGGNPQAAPSPAQAKGRERCCPAGARFEIRVRGHLDSKWSDWLEGMQVEPLENGEMIFTGPIEDQSALMGILNKLVLLNLALISINPMERGKYEP